MMATHRTDLHLDSPGELIIIAADTPKELIAQLRRSPEDMGMDFKDYARASQRCFKASAPLHIAVVAQDEGDLLNKAELVAHEIRRTPTESFVRHSEIFYTCRSKKQN
ncbi:MAG: hypothetical protein VX834_08805 [Myxococcota bacterium]|nr:hypothetical protein [Myxococcota bacterium]